MLEDSRGTACEPSMLRAILDIILPRVCLLCAAHGNEDGLCPACASRMLEKRIRSPICTVCGAPLPGSAGPDHACGECLSERVPFICARSALAADGAVLDAIHRFKYGHEVNLAGTLAAIMATVTLPEAPSVIVPVPLHVRRLRERGFNQSLLLANELSKALNAPVDYANLKKRMDTPQQARCNADERKRNVKGAFEVTRPGAFKGSLVLLIDDVYTTGATIKECAATLKRDGAKVMALTLARAVKV